MKQIYKQYMYSYPHKTAYYPLEKGEIVAQLAAVGGDCSLYVHIPFCQAKCGYCNLFSVAARSDLIPSYIEAIGRQALQMASLGKKLHFTSLVLGGGTPSMLSIEQLKALFFAIESAFKVKIKDLQGEIELAPNQTNRELLAFLREWGFRRVSMGVQSFVPSELALLSRVHSKETCQKALATICEMGFDCVNSDLIYGLPKQTMESLGYSIETMLGYQLDEIFIYPLYVKPHTPLWGKITLDEAHMRHLYHQAREKLLAAGYSQISMRRFVKTAPRVAAEGCGFSMGLALGCGGRSYLGNLHLCEPYQITPVACTKALEAFCQKSDFLTGLSGYCLEENEEKRRYCIKNLLHTSGLPRGAYEKLFCTSPETDFPFINDLYREKLAENRGETIYLTPEGLGLSDQIGPMFISPRVEKASGDYYKNHQQKEKIK